MKRAVVASLWIFVSAGSVLAQLGKPGAIDAGTPEDRAMTAIEKEADAAKRIDLLEKFVQDFPAARLLGYRRLQASYLQLGQQEADAARKTEWLNKSILSGLSALRLDPRDFATMANLTRAFAQKQDVAQAFNYGILAGDLLQQLKAMGPPEGTQAAVWESTKAGLVDQHRADYQYLEYTLFQLASQQPDPAALAELFERYLETFGDSNYLVPACVALADTMSEMGKNLERAEALAQRIPELADKAARPENQTEEQWTQQTNTWKGLALSIQGQILMHQEKTPEAIAKFTEAEPLLAAAPVARARNLFRLGYAYAKLGRLDPARRYLMQVVALESPYKAAAQDVLNKVEQRRPKRPQ